MPGLHILHLIDSLRRGGAELLLRDLAARQLELGHRVSVGYSTPGPLVRELEARGIRTIHLPRLARVDPILAWRIYRLARRARPDVLHTHLFKSDFHGRLAGRLAGVPVIVSTLHSSDPWAQNPVLGWLYGQTARFADGLIAVSEEVRRYHRAQTGVPPEKIRTIENGIALARFREDPAARAKFRGEFGLSPQETVLGVVGRLVPDKGMSVFLEAAAQVRAAAQVQRDRPEIRFLIAGEGPLREMLETQARESSLEGQVIFCGFREDVPALMQAIDLLIFSSLREGLPLALLEGMAAGKPVIATAVGGIPGVVVDGETGVLIPPGEAGALARACLQVLQDPARMQEMGAAGKRRVEERHSLDRMVDLTMKFYEESKNAHSK